jgi:hypothetical protein
LAQEEFRRLAQEFDAIADELALPTKHWKQVWSWLKQMSVCRGAPTA